MGSEGVAAHRALEAMWKRLYDAFDGTRFERRDDLILVLCPAFPIPQFNGAWIGEDSQTAVDALPGAIAEVEAAGALPWVQTRSRHKRTRQAAIDLGLTHEERIPGMAVRAGELAEVGAEIEIALVVDDDRDETNRILAVSFDAAKELFDGICDGLWTIDEVSWYVGRVGGAIVSTAVGFTADGATGIFNVATPPQHRGRGYGAALTARAVRDGFDAGSEFAFLQSSEMGRSVYHRLGFRNVEEYVLLTRPLAAA